MVDLEQIPVVVEDEKNVRHSKRLQNVVDKHYLIGLLTIALIVAFTAPTPGQALGALCKTNGVVLSSSLHVWNTFNAIAVTIIFFMSGLSLRTAEIKGLHASGWPFMVGMILILIVTPTIGFLVAGTQGIPDVNLRLGVALFPLMPTTLSSGIVIVGIAKGSQVLALVFTLMASLVSIGLLAFTVPRLVELIGFPPSSPSPPPPPPLSGNSSSSSSSSIIIDANNTVTSTVTIPAAPIVLSLVFSTLIPLIWGKFCRDVSRYVANAVDTHRHVMKYLSGLLIALIVLIQLSDVQHMFVNLNHTDVVEAILAACAIHILLLLMCIGTAQLTMPDPRRLPEKKAVAFMGAQKSLPVALLILTSLTDLGFTGAGVAALPLVLAQFWQTLVDSLYASWIVKSDLLGRAV